MSGSFICSAMARPPILRICYIYILHVLYTAWINLQLGKGGQLPLASPAPSFVIT